MSIHKPLSGSRLALLEESLSARDMSIIRQVGELRLMSARQLRTLHFPAAAHQSEIAAARACHRALQRLASDRLLVRLERRIGGARAGSTGFIYALGPAGQRVLRDGRPRRRYYEPTARFVDHTLAISQLVVDATVGHRAGSLHLRGYRAEPACWRAFSRAGVRVVLRPDLFLALDSDEYALKWMVEIDRSSESLPVILRKCRLYAGYYQTGIEQSWDDGTFPRICWIAPTERRAQHIRTAIGRDRTLPKGLFVVTHTERGITVLTGGAP